MRGGLLLGDVALAFPPRERVVDLDQKPLVLLVGGRARLHAHEMPAPFQARAFERERQVALVEPEMRIALRHPAPAIPYDHGAAAVLALRDVALELEVLHRMVFGLHGQPLLVRAVARTVRSRP